MAHTHHDNSRYRCRYCRLRTVSISVGCVQDDFKHHSGHASYKVADGENSEIQNVLLTRVIGQAVNLTAMCT